MQRGEVRSRRRWVRTLALAFLGCGLSPAQPLVELREASARRPPQGLPALYQRQVKLRGTVSHGPVPVIEYSHLAIADEKGFGAVLEGELNSFEGIRPGTVVEASGMITHRAGLPVLRVAALRVLKRGPAPAPRRARLAELNSDRHLGIYVVTEGTVRAAGVNRGGHFLEIQEPEIPPVTVFLPHRAVRGPGLSGIRRGDRVRVAGIAHQYCPLPPYNRDYQILIGDASAVQVLHRAWPIPPEMIGGFFGALALAFGLWLLYERRVRKKRRGIRRLYALGEEMTAPAAPIEKLKNLQTSIAAALDVSEVRLYVWDRDAGLLRRISEAGIQESYGVNVEGARGFRGSALALCFTGRALLEVPDVRESPFLGTDDASQLPPSALFLPMFAQQELLGILEIDGRRARRFAADEQAVLQHLANQIAIGMKLLEQQTIRERTYRTEKLVATGQLIGTLASELKAPLEIIAALSEAAQSDETLAVETVRSIASTAKEAAAILARLLPLTGEDQIEATDLAALLRGLLDTLQVQWKDAGVRGDVLIPAGTVPVAAPPGALRGVFSSLLRRAFSPGGTFSVRVAELAGKVVVEIAPAREAQAAGVDEPEERPFSIALCRTILQNYGGVLRTTGQGEARRWEVELRAPGYGPDALSPEAHAALPRLTALVVDPDPESRHTLVGLLGEAGHRAVPVAGGEEAIRLADRFRFQILVCPSILAGTSWLHLVERTRNTIGRFLVVTEHAGPELAMAVEERGGRVLVKPVRPADLARALATLTHPGAETQG
ncbi:MAG TPA: GAF domain-containing protein [Bryobacteraceae bacterium]|nr:GAF domain-containing protein [Bryobacteraceae bacterium]